MGTTEGRNRLERSRSDRVLGGVCGGVARYLRLEATLVRVFFVLLALSDGIGVFLYLLLWIVLPAGGGEEPTLGAHVGRGLNEMGRHAGEFAADVQQVASQPKGPALRWIGITFVLLGVFFLLRNLDLVWFRWLEFGFLWPILLIAAGIVVLVRRGFSDGT